MVVKRAVRGSVRPIRKSRGQLEGLGGQPQDLGNSQGVWEASKGVWRVKLAGGRRNENPDLPCVAPYVIDPFGVAAQK